MPSSSNATGYKGVVRSMRPSRIKRYQVQVTRNGKKVTLGYFLTCEEAALCYAKAPEGEAAARAGSSSRYISR